MRKLFAAPEMLTAILLVIAIVIGAQESKYFLDPFYLLDQIALNAEAGLLVLGMTFVIVCGEIDLSVASSLALSACVVAKLIAAGMPAVSAVVLGILLGGLLGAFNGALVAYAKLPSFLVTLGTLAFFRGAAQALMGAASVELPKSFGGLDDKYLPFTGVPIAVGILFASATVAAAVLHRTVFGRWVFAVGSNEEAARFAAVPSNHVKFATFVISGALAGGAGSMTDASLGVARYDHAKGLELIVITAAVLGGTSIYGGRGTILGSILALLLVTVIRGGMGLANVPTDYQLAIIGGILIVAVGLNLIGKKRSFA